MSSDARQVDLGSDQGGTAVEEARREFRRALSAAAALSAGWRDAATPRLHTALCALGRQGDVLLDLLSRMAVLTAGDLPRPDPPQLDPAQPTPVSAAAAGPGSGPPCSRGRLLGRRAGVGAVEAGARHAGSAFSRQFGTAEQDVVQLDTIATPVFALCDVLHGELDGHAGHVDDAAAERVRAVQGEYLAARRAFAAQLAAACATLPVGGRPSSPGSP